MIETNETFLKTHSLKLNSVFVFVFLNNKNLNKNYLVVKYKSDQIFLNFSLLITHKAHSLYSPYRQQPLQLFISSHHDHTMVIS